jgi:hypothetical protein
MGKGISAKLGCSREQQQDSATNLQRTGEISGKQRNLGEIEKLRCTLGRGILDFGLCSPLKLTDRMFEKGSVISLGALIPPNPP